MGETTDIRRERGGRAGRPARAGIEQPARRQPVRRFPPAEIVSADQIEAIHDASMTILEEVGMDFFNAKARDILRAAGAEIEGHRVRFDRA